MYTIPFTHIAISLSGGGYRAAAFHLGALSLLDSINLKDMKGIPEEERLLGRHTLLENVKIITMISGGTFTGMMYALKLAEGKEYRDCFTKLYGLLEEDKLVEKALAKLNGKIPWQSSHKTRDTINAFAEVENG